MTGSGDCFGVAQLCATWLLCRSANYCCTRYGIIDDQKTAAIAIGRAGCWCPPHTWLLARAYYQQFCSLAKFHYIPVWSQLWETQVESVYEIQGSSIDHSRSVAFWCFPHPFFLSTAGVFGDDLIIAVAWAAWRSHPRNTLHLGCVSITVDSQCGGFLRGFFREFTTPCIWGNDPILLYTTMFQMGGTKTPPRNGIP